MDKKFIGRVQQIQTKYGEMVKIGIPEKDFVQHIKNGWVNMVLKKNKEGKMYLEIDDFEPKEKSGPTHTAKNEGQFIPTKAMPPPIGEQDNSLPF